MKKCPYCAEEIQDAAIKCKFCGEFLEASPGISAAGAPPPPPAHAAPVKKLTRSSTDKMLGGVCSGVAAYTNMDVTLVRVLTALVVFFTAIVPGIVIYAICALVIPEESTS